MCLAVYREDVRMEDVRASARARGEWQKGGWWGVRGSGTAAERTQFACIVPAAVPARIFPAYVTANCDRKVGLLSARAFALSFFEPSSHARTRTRIWSVSDVNFEKQKREFVRKCIETGRRKKYQKIYKKKSTAANAN